MHLSQFRMQGRPGGGLVIGAPVPLYELSRGETHEGAYTQGLDPMAIVTPSEQWAVTVQEIPVGGSSSWREITLGIPSIAAAGPLEYYADRRRLGRGAVVGGQFVSGRR